MTLRVLHIHAEFTRIGGAELYVAHLTRALAERGHTVAIATRSPASVVRGVVADDRVAIAELSVRHPFEHVANRKRSAASRAVWHAVDVFNPTVIPSLSKVLKRQRPDVVHVHNFQGLSTAVFAAARHRAALHTAHNFLLVDPGTTLVDRRGEVMQRLSTARALRARAVRRVLRHTPVIFPSERTLALHVAVGWKRRTDDVVLPHGWPGFGATAAAGRTAEHIAVYAGRLDRSKGLDLLLEAWPGDAGWRLVVAGAGPLEAMVRRHAALDPSIEFVGWLERDRLSGLLSRASVVLLPTRSPETFSLTTAEAFLHGVPVVCSAVAGPPTLIPGRNGLAVEGGPPEWRAALTALFGDETLLAELARGAASSSAGLAWEEHVEAVERLYREAAELAR